MLCNFFFTSTPHFFPFFIYNCTKISRIQEVYLLSISNKKVSGVLLFKTTILFLKVACTFKECNKMYSLKTEYAFKQVMGHCWLAGLPSDCAAGHPNGFEAPPVIVSSGDRVLLFVSFFYSRIFEK